jgi:hypothetical protein
MLRGRFRGLQCHGLGTVGEKLSPLLTHSGSLVTCGYGTFLKNRGALHNNGWSCFDSGEVTNRIRI